MRNPIPANNPRFAEAFAKQERIERLTNTKVGCVLVITLMPAGSLLDAFVYPELLYRFFIARVLCSLLAAAILAFLFTDKGKRCAPWLGVIVPMLPAVFIAWMIYEIDGFNSKYYAGLNLVLLAVGAVLRWTFLESVIAVTLVLIMYIFAGFLNGTSTGMDTLFNNFYFIALMDLIVVVGTYFQYHQRLREFSLRYELDQNKKELEDNHQVLIENKKELEASHQKLVELDQIKNRFFGNISHELRTPLTLLLAPLETLLNRFRDRMDDRMREMLVTMHGNGMRLLKLINDLLDLVRLESGRLEIKREPLLVGEFLQAIQTAAQQMADDKSITLATEVGDEVGHVMLDRDRLEKVLLNLVFNALKFTPRGGTVRVVCRREGESLNIQVRDTGIGIPQNQLPHIFDRFWQADGSSKRKFQGVGIGLSLVKELVEAHGGGVTVTSKEGQGSTFEIGLPYLEGAPTARAKKQGVDSVAAPKIIEFPAPTQAATEAESEPGSEGKEEIAGDEASGTVSDQEWLSGLYRRAELFSSKHIELGSRRERKPVSLETAPSGRPKVLIADDEFGMRQFIRSQLEDIFQVEEVEDGQQAVEQAKVLLPDIIIMDMMMPEKDGLQASQELRQHGPTSEIPIIMLTARADEEIKLTALRAGVSDFLPKPFSTTELQVRLRNLVNSYEYQRELSRKNVALETAIEQLKETELQLVQTEKLASLGRLSAGIIHEINNPLNFATTGLYMLRRFNDGVDEAVREDFDSILSDVEEGLTRVKTIVSDLRSFSHHENDILEWVPVEQMVEESLRFLGQESQGRVTVEKDFSKDLSIYVNKNKMIQVLLNLLQNALDALRTKQFSGEEQARLRIAAWEDAAADRYVLSVKDNGPGIDAEVRNKIFDPFFTTKDVGEGMGLGLSISYRIVKSFSGHIEVLSEPGRGCEFQIKLPRVGEDESLETQIAKPL